MKVKYGSTKVLLLLFSIILMLVLYQLGLAAQTIEVGRVDVDENWRTVRLNNNFRNPVLVAKPLSYNGSDPAVVRIQNLDSNSFQVRVQEWSYLNDEHNDETVSYLVTERGTFTLGSGMRLEAGLISTDATGDFESVRFSNSFRQTPVVFSSVLTYNGSAPVVTRNQNVTRSRFEVMMQEEEANEPKHAEERIGYIAIEPGTGNLSGRRFEVGRATAAGENFRRIRFGFGESVTIIVDEETSVDPEKSHAEETVGYFAVQGGPRYFIADMQTTNGGNTANLRYGGEIVTDQGGTEDQQAQQPSKAAPKGIIIEPPAQSELDISVRTDRYQYQIGSDLRIFLDLSRRAYVYVFDYDTRGEMRLVFPNRYSQNNLIGPGRYELPDRGYSFKVTGPPGVEFVQAVASTKRIDVNRLLKDPDDPFARESYPPVADPEKLNQEFRSRLEAKFELQIGGGDPKAQFRIVPVSWDSDTTSFRVGEISQPNQRPVARFDYQPGDPRTGESINFSAHSSYDPDGSIVNYYWDFDGNGRTDASGRRVSHTYYSSGQYNVRLTVEDNDGAVSSSTRTISVSRENQSPSARFTYSPGQPVPNEVVTFDGSNSFDPDGNIVSYRWDFNDDGFTDSYGRRTSRSFGSSGSFIVTLRVVDDDGASSRTSQTVRVESDNQEPYARFTYSPDRPEPGESISFDASNSSDPDGYISSYRWDFDGDNRTDAYGRRVSHDFGSAGSYDVRLTVVDNDGGSSSSSQTVRVERENQNPSASFDFSPSRPEPGERINFDGSGSYDPDGSIISHRWDFDGDGRTDAYGSRTSHSFGSAGSYGVTLTVLDNENASSSTTKTVQVERPQLRFASAEPDSFNSNVESEEDWYWLKSFNHYGEWSWYWIPDTPGSAYLNLEFLVTNRENGGSGFNATVEIQILDFDGNTIERGTATVENPFRPDYSGDTEGVGYEASGNYEVRNPSQLRNGFKVRVEWPPRDSRNILAVNKDSILLAYTN